MNSTFIIVIISIWTLILIKSSLSQNKKQNDLKNREYDINRKKVNRYQENAGIPEFH